MLFKKTLRRKSTEEDSSIKEIFGPESPRDAITKLLSDGARRLIREALESDLEDLVAGFSRRVLRTLVDELCAVGIKQRGGSKQKSAR